MKSLLRSRRRASSAIVFLFGAYPRAQATEKDTLDSVIDEKADIFSSGQKPAGRIGRR
jgi:hypothetical protein